MFDAAHTAGIEPGDGDAAEELTSTRLAPGTPDPWPFSEPTRDPTTGPQAVSGRADSPGLPAWAGGSAAAVLSAPLNAGDADDDRWGGLPRRGRASASTPPERTAPPPRDTGRPSWAAATGPGAVMAAVPARTVVPRLHVPSPIFGPPGKQRISATVVCLGLLTLGVYPLFWHHRVNREMGDFDPRMRVRPGRSTIAVSVPVLAGLLVAVAAAARIVLDRTGMLPHLPLSAATTRWGLVAPVAAQYLLLLVPWSVLAVGLTLERVRSVQDHVGVPTDRQLRPASAMAWLLLPLVGPLVLLATAQRRLNEIWELTG